MTRKENMCMLIVVMLLSLQMSGCGVSQGDFQKEQVTDYIVEDVGQPDNPISALADKSEIDQAAQHMLTVWSDYMDVLEKMYASELWALDYVDAYLESGDWKDLVKARAACIASARYLAELSMTEDDLTEEEYLILANEGIDTSYQTVEFLSVPIFLDGAHKVIRNQLLVRLEYDVYYESSINILKNNVSMEQETISIMCQRCCIDTNYLLLTLGDDVVSESYWSAMQEDYPVLASGRAEWIGSETELEEAADACMDEYEDMILRKSDLISMAEAELYQITQIIGNKDLAAIQEAAHAMVNVPDLLPFPTWYNPNMTGYLSVILDEDGNVSYPESGDDLVDARYGVYMQVENVAEEEIAAYIDIAKSYALDAWKSEDSGSWYIRMPDYNVKFDCGDDATTIFFSGADVTFAPNWYIK